MKQIHKEPDQTNTEYLKIGKNITISEIIISFLKSLFSPFFTNSAQKIRIFTIFYQFGQKNTISHCT